MEFVGTSGEVRGEVCRNFREVRGGGLVSIWPFTPVASSPTVGTEPLDFLRDSWQLSEMHEWQVPFSCENLNSAVSKFPLLTKVGTCWIFLTYEFG